MLIYRLILAGLAIGAVAWRPRSWPAAACAATCAMLVAACGLGSGNPAVLVALPPIAFLTAVMGLALLVDGSGLAGRLADLLAAAGRGRVALLFGWVCLGSALLTAALSLDGAVVVMVPLLLALFRRHGAPLRPLLLATVGVANAFSSALPAGNPTNLMVMDRLELSAAAFSQRMLLPSLGAMLACVAVLSVMERTALRGTYDPGVIRRGPLDRGERLALAALAAAALADWLSLLLGRSPWEPVVVVAAIALVAARRPPPIALPVRVGVQLVSLLVVISGVRAGLDLGGLAPSAPTLGRLALVAGGVSAVAAIANNLPASAAVAALLGPGLSSQAALLGLSAGALVTPHGSVATLVSLDLAGYESHGGLARAWSAAAVAAVTAGTLLLWLWCPES
jgi:arsenical pump membrane protein